MRKDRVPIAATFSKDPSFWGKGFIPEYIVSGNGALVTGSDSKTYVDWVSGLGANLLGHGHIGFSHHVSMHLKRGTAFSLPHELEYTVAEKLTNLLSKHVPGWSNVDLQVRWVKEGSGACSAAARLARAATGKMHIVNCGYRGWHDIFVAGTPPAHGIPAELGQYVHSIKFNDINGLWDCNRYDVAAVIVEQPPEEANENWYQQLKIFCQHTQCYLIMDEVVTGFRYARGGASELYSIQPNLMCLGKALGNGMPIAALVGPKDLMDWFARNDPVFVSSTNAGEVASLAATDFMLDYISNGEYLTKLWETGLALLHGLNKAGWYTIGNAPRSLVTFKTDAEKAFFIARMRDNGFLVNRPNFPTMAHNIDIANQTTQIAKTIRQEWETLTRQEKTLWEDKAPVTLFRNR